MIGNPPVSLSGCRHQWSASQGNATEPAAPADCLLLAQIRHSPDLGAKRTLTNRSLPRGYPSTQSVNLTAAQDLNSSPQTSQCEPWNYVDVRRPINPHTSRMSTAPTMLAMKPAP